MEEFIAIVPKQPYRPQAVSNEVRMEFEAVLLDAQGCNSIDILDLGATSVLGNKKSRTVSKFQTLFG